MIIAKNQLDSCCHGGSRQLRQQGTHFPEGSNNVYEMVRAACYNYKQVKYEPFPAPKSTQIQLIKHGITNIANLKKKTPNRLSHTSTDENGDNEEQHLPCQKTVLTSQTSAQPIKLNKQHTKAHFDTKGSQDAT